MKVMTKNEIHTSFAMILEITDAELSFIEEEPTRLFIPKIMQELMKSKGKNAHIVQLTLENPVEINKYVKTLMKSYDSVSWINRDNKFHVKRNVNALFN